MKMRSKMQNEKGFTLVELMVVVVILGILVAIAVPVYNSVTDKAARNAHDANLRTIDGAIMLYQADNDGKNPTKIEDLDLQAIPAIPEKVKDNLKETGETPTDKYSIVVSGKTMRAAPLGGWTGAYSNKS